MGRLPSHAELSEWKASMKRPSNSACNGGHCDRASRAADGTMTSTCNLHQSASASLKHRAMLSICMSHPHHSLGYSVDGQNCGMFGDCRMLVGGCVETMCGLKKVFLLLSHIKPVFLADNCALQNFPNFTELISLQSLKPTYLGNSQPDNCALEEKEKSSKISPQFSSSFPCFLLQMFSTIFKLSLTKSNLPFWTVANQTTMSLSMLWAAVLSATLL